MKKISFLLLCLSVFIALGAREKNLIRFIQPNNEFVNKVTNEHFDIALYLPNKFIDLVLTQEEFNNLKALNPNFTLIQSEAQMKDNLSSNDRDIAGYHSYQEINDMLTEIANTHPDICTLHNIGQSIGAEYSQQGIANYADFNHNVLAIKLSDNPETEEDEPSFYFFGVHHAREPLSAEVSLAILNHLLDNYENDQEIANIINNSQVWFVPLVNPDGHKIVLDQTDVWWRKNIRDNNQNQEFDDFYQYGYGTDGVDINRNYETGWGYFSSTDDFDYPTYHGTAPFSEPETMNIKNLIDAHQFVAGVSFHTYGGLILYPWGSLPNVYSPDYLALADLAENMAMTILKTDDSGNYYDPGFGWELYAASGGLDEYAYGVNSTFAYTIELAEEFIPPANIVNQTCINNLTAAKILLNRVNQACVTGLIKDLQNNPLEAEVYIEGVDNLGLPKEKYKSNSLFGRYYRLLMPGMYNVSIHKWGYESVSQPITILETEKTELNLTLTASQVCQLNVLVLDEFEMPVPNVKISFPDSELNDIYTDNQGLAYYPTHFTGMQRIIVDLQGSDKINKYINLHEGLNNYTFNLASPIILDSFDDGPLNWERTGTWGLTSSEFVTPSKSLADSPNTQYQSATNSFCKYPEAINLMDCSDALVSFMTKYDFNLNSDYVSLEISIDNQNWYTLDVYVESQDEWTEKYYSLNNYINQMVYLRFHLVSANQSSGEGIYLDDFRIIKNNNPVSQNDLVLDNSHLLALGNYPNPFNPETKISFNLNHPDKINCNIYNIKGQKVKSFQKYFDSIGKHEFSWNGKDSNNKNIASGVYFYTLSNNEKKVSRKMILIK